MLTFSSQVAVVWRSGLETLNFDWLDLGWVAEGHQLASVSEKLRALVQQWLTNNKEPPHFVRFRQEINNEHALVSRLLLPLFADMPN